MITLSHNLFKFLAAKSRQNTVTPADIVHTPKRHLLQESSITDPALQLRYEREDNAEIKKSAVIGCLCVIIFTPACSILDLLIYPHLAVPFFKLRLICSAIGVLMLLGLNTNIGNRYIRLYPMLLPIIPSIFICIMIFVSRDPSSHYYAGLSFCLVATCFVFNWTFREIIFTLAVITISYFVATLPNLLHGAALEEINIYYCNLTFFFMTATVLCVTSVRHHSIRVREFLLRCQAEIQHTQLKAQNEQLQFTIDRLKQTEAQLDHNDRLASIGRLSAGIIHEINNPLNFVKSALYVLKKRSKNLPGEHITSVKEIASDIEEGVDRVVGIVSDLRSFAHPEQQPLKAVQVAPVLAKTERFLQKAIHDSNVKLNIEPSADRWVMANDREVLQVLINLTQNSIDALQGRPNPEITITTGKVDDLVYIAVRDNGCGISNEQINHIFDPFFTTKDVGKGMGLGLSICYRMMQQMLGTIQVASIPGEYTCFTLYFTPATAPQNADSPQTIAGHV